MKPLLHLIAGTRADFAKLVPLARACLEGGRLEHQLIDAGSLEPAAADAVLHELGVPQPPVRLAVDVQAGADWAGQVALGYRSLSRIVRPDALVVAGASEAAMSCAKFARKAGIAVIQVEGGLRAGGSSAEELRRIDIDQLADRHFVGGDLGVLNLVREGINAGRIHAVGSLLVDNHFHLLDALRALPGEDLPGEHLKKLAGGRYGVVALQHPDNLGNSAALARITSALRELSTELPLIFSVAPATRASLERSETQLGAGVFMLRELGILEFVNVWKDAALVLTDSSSLQEEAAAAGVPCVTLRDATERRATLDLGTNVVVGAEPTRILAAARNLVKQGRRPVRMQLWDGKAATRIADVLAMSVAAAA